MHATSCPARFTSMTSMSADAARRAGSRFKRFATRRRWVAATAAIGVMAAGALAFRAAGGGSDPGSTITRNGEIRLQGKITYDSCYAALQIHLPVGDVGCSLTVNDRSR